MLLRLFVFHKEHYGILAERDQNDLGPVTGAQFSLPKSSSCGHELIQTYAIGRLEQDPQRMQTHTHREKERKKGGTEGF